MKRFRLLTCYLAVSASAGLLVPAIAAQESDAGKRPERRALDVMLHDGGLFLGQVVDAQGRAKSDVIISLRQRQRELARTKTDHLGRFAVKGLNGGTYQLATVHGQLQARMWTRSTAPPNVAAGALLVEGVTVRGQNAGPPSSVYGDGVASFNQARAGSTGPGNSVLVSPDPGSTLYTSGETIMVEGAEVGNAAGASFVGPEYGSATPGGGWFGFGLLGRDGLLASRAGVGLAGTAVAIAIPAAILSDDAS